MSSIRKDINIGIIDQAGSQSGSWLYSYNLFYSIRKCGVKCFLFSIINNPPYCMPTFLPIKFIGIKLFDKLFNFVKGYIKSYKIAKKHKINWMILQIYSFSFIDLFAFLLPFLFNIYTIAVVHDVEPFESEKGKSKLIRFIILNYFAKLIIVHNDYSYSCIIKYIKKRKRKYIKIIKHGAFTEEKYLKEIYHDKEKIVPECVGLKDVILFFGQIKYEKGLDLFLNALRYIKYDNFIVIAGRIRDKKINYKDIVIKEKLEKKVIIIDRYISEAEKNYLFNIAKVIVLPYRRVFQSGVLLLAMSKRKVIIASDLEPFKEIIKDKYNGFLFKAGSIYDLQDKINFVLSCDENFLEQIRNNAHIFVKNNYSWEEIANQYCGIINEFQNKNL